MQRDQLGSFIGATSRLALDHLRDPRVQLAPSLVRKALVGGVANERVPEPESARDIRIALDEFTETVPCLRACRDERVVLEDIGD
jgi:hypothetical protein